MDKIKKLEGEISTLQYKLDLEIGKYNADDTIDKPYKIGDKYIIPNNKPAVVVSCLYTNSGWCVRLCLLNHDQVKNGYDIEKCKKSWHIVSLYSSGGDKIEDWKEYIDMREATLGFSLEEVNEYKDILVKEKKE